MNKTELQVSVIAYIELILKVTQTSPCLRMIDYERNSNSLNNTLRNHILDSPHSSAS